MNPVRPFGASSASRASAPAPAATQLAVPAAAPSAPSASPAAARGFDQQAMQRIEANRQRHGRLRDLRVRALGDVERFTAESERDAQVVLDKYGTADLGELRTRFGTIRAKVNAEIDAYEAAVASVEADLRILGEQV